MAKLNWQRKEPLRTREDILNEAISKLIVIKKRRVEDGRPYREIIRAQKEIDKMIKMRDNFRTADKFVKWRKYHE